MDWQLSLIAVPLANMAAKTIGGRHGAVAEFLIPAPYNGYSATFIQQAIVALVVPLLAAAFARLQQRPDDRPRGDQRLWYRRQCKTKRQICQQERAVSDSAPDASFAAKCVSGARPGLALTLFTLVLGGAIFIGVYNLWASFDKVIEDIQGYFLADINISFGP